MSHSQPILITGATGQVGAALAAILPGPLLTPTRAELDLASPASIRAYIQQHTPRWIINPAAYTAVDKAESEPDLAHAINAEAPRILGEEAVRIGAPVLHFSTDYVFDGTQPTPYLESDPTNPVSVYGRTKLLGEQSLAATGAAHIILRTSWVYASTGKNFLLTILKFARERPELKIVADQHGTPTAARDLATLAAHLLATPDPSSGLYHATSQGETTWHGFASEFLRQRQQAEPQTRFANLIPIPTSAYPTPAHRPANSRLSSDKLFQRFNFRLPPWQQALATVLAEIPVL